MAHLDLSHRRTHNLLLISKLLNQRDAASPLTLVLDTLEQPAKPLIREYLRRAEVSLISEDAIELSKTHTIFLSFETIRQPSGISTFISCFDKTHTEISRALSSVIATAAATSKRVLLLIDSLATLATLSTQPSSSLNLTAYLSSFLAPPRQHPQTQLSLIAVYHTDIPISTSAPPYSPSPLSLLAYLATTITTVHSLAILVAEKAARDKSLPVPFFGLAEEVEGIIVGLKPNAKLVKPEDRGIVLELEHRRKSGRGVLEWYFLPSSTESQLSTPQAFRETVILLDDHPLFRRQKEEEQMSEQELVGMTFELGLTDRQRQDREGVVLPYFDAQKAGGGGEGGRILYDMGVEDDFDEEEDEI